MAKTSLKVEAVVGWVCSNTGYRISKETTVMKCPAIALAQGRAWLNISHLKQLLV